MAWIQRTDGKIIVTAAGKAYTPECPPPDECCDATTWPPWGGGDTPPWFETDPPPAPQTGECASGCDSCGCTEPCTPRPDGLHVACCRPQSPTEIVVRFSGTATGRIDYEPGTSGDLLSQEVLVEESSTWSSISGLTGTYRQRQWTNNVLTLDLSTDASARDDDCPVPPTGVFVGYSLSLPLGPPCYGLRSLIETVAGGTRTSSIYSDCRRSFFRQTFSAAIPGDRTTSSSTQTFLQVTYTPDGCTTPRLCDPAAGGAFIPDGGSLP